MSVTIGREGPTQLCVPLSSLRDKAGVYLAAARYWAERALEVCERSLCRPTMTTSLARHLARINSPSLAVPDLHLHQPSPSTISTTKQVTHSLAGVDSPAYCLWAAALDPNSGCWGGGSPQQSTLRLPPMDFAERFAEEFGLSAHGERSLLRQMCNLQLVS